MEPIQDNASAPMPKSHKLYYAVVLLSAMVIEIFLYTLFNQYLQTKDYFVSTQWNTEQASIEPYKILNNKVYYGGINIGADAKSFKLLVRNSKDGEFSKDDYAIDNNFAWKGRYKISGADPKTFKVLGVGNYSMDKNFVYYDDERLENVATSSFVSMGKWHGKDTKHIYHLKFTVVSSSTIDIKHVRELNYGIIADEEGVYVADWANAIIGAGDFAYKKAENTTDPKTLRFVGECAYPFDGGGGPTSYYMDKNYVYLNAFDLNFEKLDNIDAASFRVFESQYSWNIDRTWSANNFAGDKNHVYVGCGEILEGADPDSFVYLGDIYAKDKDHVFTLGGIVKDADRKTFQLFGRSMAKDKNNVYLGQEKIQGVDAATFEKINDKYWKDKENIFTLSFSRDDLVRFDADVKTFKVLSNQYAKDKDHVFYAGSEDPIVKGADAKTFQVFSDDSEYAKDSSSVYCGSSVLMGADSSSFQMVSLVGENGIGDVAKDKNHVYVGICQVAGGVDPKDCNAQDLKRCGLTWGQ
jgi:hypothetical protein